MTFKHLVLASCICWVAACSFSAEARLPQNHMDELIASSTTQKGGWTATIPSRDALRVVYTRYRTALKNAYLALPVKPERTVDKPWVTYLLAEFQSKRLSGSSQEAMKKAMPYRAELVLFAGENAVRQVEIDFRTPIDSAAPTH